MSKGPSLSLLNLVFRMLALVLLLGSGFLFLVAADFEISRVLGLMRTTRPVDFILAMSILPLLGFPISAFYLYAGSAFAWWQAWLCSVVALAINICLAYPFARILLHRPISALLMKYGRMLPSLTDENHFRITFLVRAVPGIPFFMQNYLLPVLGIRFMQYWLISWLIQSTFAAGMAAIPHLVEKGGWIVAAVVVWLFILAGILRRFYVRPGERNKEAFRAKPSA